MTTENAIIFINNSDSTPKKSRLSHNLTFFQSVKLHFSLHPSKLPKRIIASLVPPICNNRFKKINVDLLGPILAILILIILLYHGHNNKLPWAVSSLSPNDLLLCYIIFMPILTYILCKLAKSSISFIEIVAILGYSLYGHIFTLIFSFVFNAEYNNLIFFCAFLLFAGLSTLRIVIILVAYIPKPALRLIICSFVSVVQLLFLVFLQFLYMHSSFVYGRKSKF